MLTGSVVLAEGLVAFILRTVAGSRRILRFKCSGKTKLSWTDGCGLSPEDGDSIGRMPRPLMEDNATFRFRYSSPYHPLFLFLKSVLVRWRIIRHLLLSRDLPLAESNVATMLDYCFPNYLLYIFIYFLDVLFRILNYYYDLWLPIEGEKTRRNMLHKVII